MKSWAIAVGINQYPERAGQRVLKGAVADAADFADWALDPRGGAVDPARLYFWTHPKPANPTQRLADFLRNPTPWWNPDTDLKAPNLALAPKKDEIVETALRAGAEAKADALEGDAEEVRRIYVFFAGHGLQSNTSGSAMEVQTCFAAADFRPDAMTVIGLIPCEDLRRALLAGGFDEVFMFLDCCRLAMTKLNLPAPNILSPNTRLPSAPKWGVGNAAQKNKVAFETLSPPRRGAFSKTLLDGLRTVRDPATQDLTVESLRAYVRDNIGAHTKEEQRPNFIADPDDPSPIVLTGPPIPSPPVMATIRIRFATVPEGAEVRLSNARGEPVGQPITVGRKAVTVQALADSFYSLDVVGTAVSKAFKHAGPGVTNVSF
jgi:hypothetical protein